MHKVDLPLEMTKLKPKKLSDFFYTRQTLQPAPDCKALKQMHSYHETDKFSAEFCLNVEVDDVDLELSQDSCSSARHQRS